MRSIAFGNQKGGVSKTSSAINLAAALAELGERVLVVDLDPSAGATRALGMEPGPGDVTTYDVLVGGAAPSAAICSAADGIDLLPATDDLEKANRELREESTSVWQLRLRRALAQLTGYDTVILDTRPARDGLVVNALAASEGVIIPTQLEAASFRMVYQLLETVDAVRAELNPGLRVLGILPTFVELRTRASRALLEQIRDEFAALHVFEPIPLTVIAREATIAEQTLFTYAPQSRVAEAYRALARSIGAREVAGVDAA